MHLLLPLLFTFPLALASLSPPLISSHDYIIIGGGTAGLALAARLSENPHLQIAVVEAGRRYETDSGNKSVVPGYTSYGASQDAATEDEAPLIDWGIVTAPIEGWGGRRVRYARGKTVGGSSARHFMV